jgi:hypothetical protein
MSFFDFGFVAYVVLGAVSGAAASRGLTFGAAIVPAGLGALVGLGCWFAATRLLDFLGELTAPDEEKELSRAQIVANILSFTVPVLGTMVAAWAIPTILVRVIFG